MIEGWNFFVFLRFEVVHILFFLRVLADKKGLGYQEKINLVICYWDIGYQEKTLSAKP